MRNNTSYTLQSLAKIRFEIILHREHTTPDDKMSFLRLLYRNGTYQIQLQQAAWGDQQHDISH